MPSSFWTQCRALAAQHPTDRILVFVPRPQLGRALETAVAQHSTRGIVGWDATTPGAYANVRSQRQQATSGRTKVPAEGRPFVMDRVLQDVQERAALDAVPAPQRLHRLLETSIQTLRLNDVDPEALDARADQQGGSLAVVAEGYRQYLRVLDERHLYDDADVFAWATADVKTHGVPPGTVVAVCDSLDLSGWEDRLLTSLQAASTAFYRLRTAPTAVDPPPTFAAHRFADAPSPSCPPDDDDRSSRPKVRFRQTIGVANEVRGVLREIIASGHPLDTVEIAYTASTPYVSLLADEIERLDLPVTVGPGIPARTSRAGHLLMTLYDWIADDYDPAHLIPLLRGGHLCTDRWCASDEGPDLSSSSVAAHELASVLASQQYAPGRDGIRDALQTALQAVQEEIDKRSDGEVSHLQTQRTRLQVAYALVVETLLDDWFGAGGPPDASPSRPVLTVQGMAAASLKVLNQLGDDVDDEDVQDEDPLEVSAHKVLRERLKALQAFSFAHEAPVSRLASLFRDLIRGWFVQADQPRPGAAHVLPLQSAGFNGRPNLYVVGMDSTTLSTAPVDDPLLPDDDLAGLSDVLSDSPPRSHADAQLWEMETALKRHHGPTTLYWCAFDVQDGEERFPSSLIQQLQREHANHEQATQQASTDAEARIGLIPDDHAIVLDEMSSWLQTHNRTAPQPQGDGADATARDVLHDRFPHLTYGEHAAAQRKAETYTSYDGDLSEGPYPALDFRSEAYAGPPLSPHRLERLSESPYAYFLRDVLNVHPLEEPALSDEPWLTPLRRGSILHATFENFLTAVQQPTEAHRDALTAAFQKAFDDEVRTHAPPRQVVEDNARRQLMADVELFFRVECAETQYTPRVLEWSVGMPRHRRRERGTSTPDDGPSRFRLAWGDDLAIPFRGTVDRIDMHDDGTLAVWDYKTGAQRFEPTDPLDGGTHLQWALYAYAVQQQFREEGHEAATVARAGYYYATRRGMGARLFADPHAYREAIVAHINDLAEAARAGDFRMADRPQNTNAWRYGDLNRICPDPRSRGAVLRKKTDPAPS